MPEIVSKNPVTDATEKHVASRSHFSLGAPRLNTYRFGEYGCMDAVEIVPDDKNFRVMLRHKLLTYTLGQPLLSRALMKKDLFYVPAPCILPLNWDKVYTNPLHGDDVNASEVGCSVAGFTQCMVNVFSTLKQCVSDFREGSPTDPQALEAEIKYALGAEMFFSNGCLLHQLGVKMQDLVSFSDSKSFDKHFDAWFAGLSTYVKSFIVSGLTSDSKTVIVDGDVHPNNLSLRQFLCLARDGFSWSITAVTKQSGKSVPVGLRPDFASSLGTTVVNLARPVAYQICCAHYFTNDKIDYIYDANLYRQNVYDALCNFGANHSEATSEDIQSAYFMLNGSQFRYDALSAFYFNYVCNCLQGMSESNVVNDMSVAFDYFRLLFGFNRSLRYMDYFTNAKSQPLAVGDVNIAVSSNKVNAIDVSKGIQRARFLNAVNRFGRRMSEYVKGLFPGVHVSPDFHDPFFLAHTTDVIGQQQVESTGENQFSQNSISTILRSDSGQYGMETDFEKPGIFIGIVYFDIERAYSMGIDRAVQHTDRYDMFNPFMQFTGDQDIRKDELMSSGNGTFGYSLRYMEYKTRTPQVSGGFVENLPGYAFLAEEERNFGENGYGDVTISPSFIRSLQTELDKFYTSLTGYSLGSYFHFIVVNDNTIEADRPMAYAPSIL